MSIEWLAMLTQATKEQISVLWKVTKAWAMKDDLHNFMNRQDKNRVGFYPAPKGGLRLRAAFIPKNWPAF